jgi:hypothetical protein
MIWKIVRQYLAMKIAIQEQESIGVNNSLLIGYRVKQRREEAPVMAYKRSML